MEKFLLLSLLLTFLACQDKETADPAPFKTTRTGTVYIGCHVGPYQFNIDSLKAYCSAPVDQDLPVDSLEVGCTYDKLHNVLAVDAQVTLERNPSGYGMDITSVTGNPTITMITLQIDGQEYQAGEYPYLSGYLLEWPDRNFRIQVANRWVGGCFHDLVIWEEMSP